MSRRERRAAAKKLQKDTTGDAMSAGALCEIGLSHLRAGRFLDAQVFCQRALAVDYDHADALHLSGLLSFQARQYDHAVEWMARAIRLNPKAEYLSNLGTALQHQGRLEEALKAFDKAAQLKPEDAETWINLGKILVGLERPAEALLSFQHALTLNPRHRDAAYRSAVLLRELERFEEALGQFDICDELQPNDALTLQMRALALCDLKRFEEALADNRRAHALDPCNADTCNNLGFVLMQLPGGYHEALDWFDKALQLRPEFIVALNNKAHSLLQLHRFEEIIAVYHRLKSLDPNDPWVDLSLGHLHLTMGNFEAGWEGHEARLQIPYRLNYYPKFSQPAWRGEEPIQGKTILIYGDEGLGDSIQFARYVPMLAARGAHVILVVHEPARALLAAIPSVSQCLPKSVDPLPPFDLHCPMSSLPRAFGTRLDTIPSGADYLPAPANSRMRAWEDRLGPHDRLRIGLVWSGSPKHKNDHNRSIPLQMFSRILDVDAAFVSLQKDPRPDDKSFLSGRPDIIDLTADLSDFTETAALLNCLDLVITVDTSVAHLAGALGRPTWILLPYIPDWRWLLDRDDSPWYPTVRLFRQTETRDYTSVLDRVRSDLNALIEEWSARAQGT